MGHVSHRLMCLNIWSPAGCDVWESYRNGKKCASLLEKQHFWIQALRVYSLALFPVHSTAWLPVLSDRPASPSLPNGLYQLWNCKAKQSHSLCVASVTLLYHNKRNRTKTSKNNNSTKPLYLIFI